MTNYTLTFLTMLAASAFMLTGCNNDPVFGPQSATSLCPCTQLGHYNTVELCCFQSTTQVCEYTLNDLFKTHRFALINSDIFDSVNGLHRYPVAPCAAITTLTIVPTLLSYEPEACPPSLCVRYDLWDKASAEKLGSFEVSANAGEAGMSCAIQRLALSFEESIRQAAH